ncbi:MAG TPA: serine/threonine-protein kinase, partial [Gemmatales bacterium]|nr:serine/threonine-protein kinase [Gemmatales bacterium]
VLDRLGKGGVSSVFKARDIRNQAVVALKVIHPELLTNKEAFGRMQREMLAATRLNHPNIVKALDIDLKGKLHYFAMEFVEGTDLHKLVQLVGALPVAEACNYARQGALGLQHAFEIGLVHRDMKPGNLLRLEGTNTVKILDFGLARLQYGQRQGSNSNVNLTMEGALIGTADYIAPEQAKSPSDVDVRADVYSLGCTLFHFLAGSPPFQGGSAMLKIFKHQTEQPTPPLQDRRPEIPPALVEIVAKMMAKNPEDRYRTPAAVAAALTSFATTDVTTSAPALRDSDLDKPDSSADVLTDEGAGASSPSFKF